ncbi:hypothetical protein Dsin_019215 [Dipteronia sinensis]|uniref:Alpha-L-arabinofuranosidase B arabinose-binding domain-containing protein n=1 Tax=Dipteronia sinensis TaxID=43782 RepID=A0AAE0E3U3_9ROSI|nr:hypothetical protein Dsin_019215 [Dipteronia sinensis]
MLEPFDLPGMLVAHQGTNDKLVVTNSPNDGSSSYFRVVSGLDGRHETVSLESDNQKGCFVYGDGNLTSGASLKLSGSTELSNAKFKQRASFVMQKGISKYNPISFVAKGANRNFVLSPLLSFRDESYAVYFKIES